MIDIIFSDIDGCLVPQHYDPLGLIQRDSESEPYFEYYRNYSGPQLVLCTGRAWANTVGILRRADLLPKQRRTWPDRPVLCEHGVDVIINPVSGERTSLIDEWEALAYLRPVAERIRDAANQLELALDQIRRELEGTFRGKITPLLLLKKQFSFAVRIPCFEGTTQAVDGSRFRQIVTQTICEPLGRLIEERTVRITQSSSAVDVMLPIGKGDGVKYLLEKYGTSPERAAYIGDSAADVEGMQQVGLACCPANAVPAVKAYVASRGDTGYLSPLAFAEAEIDILNRIRAVK